MKTILVADDEAGLLRSIARELADDGFRVLCAGDGQEALGLAAGVRLDAVVTDLLMPGMDGAELIRALAADPSTAAVPVIVISVVGPGATMLRGLTVAVHLRKPFTIGALLEAVRRLTS